MEILQIKTNNIYLQKEKCITTLLAIHELLLL